MRSGGTVRGVCGSEQVTKIAYIPVGIAGAPGILRVQVVPGTIPCLVPVYLLTAGAVIDMPGSRVHFTNISAVHTMKRRSAGDMEVSLCEFDVKWEIPATYGFVRSEIWGTPFRPTSLSLSIFDGAGQAAAVPPAMAALRPAILL